MLVRACLCLLACCASAHAVNAAYAWRLPPGFPTPEVPADNPMSDAKVELGRRLFNETRLSVNGRYACATCHRRELAYTDGLAHAVGTTGQRVKRSAMSLTNVAYNAAFTWGDMRVSSLEAQMRQPLFNQHPVEMGLRRGGAAALAVLAGLADYREQFAAAFPGDLAPVSMPHIIAAIAAFERTLISGRSPFDRYVFDDDRDALSDSAKRGMALFYSPRAGCARCHSGINFAGPIVYEGHEHATALFADTGLATPADRGLMQASRRAADAGRFRVPTLRNIALTAPYMHDGRFATLEAVLEHYMRRGHPGPRGSRRRPFLLSPSERTDLITFLGALTDPAFVDY
jgi:cytochrome c peroxidase